MKIIQEILRTAMLFIIPALVAVSPACGQNGNFTDRGHILIETGFGVTNILNGGGSGFNVFIDDGETITNLGLDAGIFVLDDLAIKANLGIFSFFGATFVNIGLGGKYYIVKKVPAEFIAGFVTGEGSTEFLGKFRAGYAIRLADNINLEPTIGAIFSTENIGGLIAVNFAMSF